MNKIIKLFVFLMVVATALINLLNLSYSVYYQKYYASYNNRLIRDYNEQLYTPGNIFTPGEYEKICQNLKPALFIPTTRTLGNWSSLTINISLIAVFIYLIYIFIFSKVKIDKKDFIPVILLLFSCVFYAYNLFLEVGLDFASCGKFLF